MSFQQESPFPPPPPPLPFRFWWVWLLLLVGGFFAARPVIHQVRDWRAHWFALEARKAFERKDYATVREKCLLSLNLTPGRVETLRIMAQLAVQMRDVGAHQLWEMVCHTPEVTPEDRLAWGEWSLEIGREKVTEEQVTILLNTHPSRDVYHLAGLLAMHQKKSKAAAEWFGKALEVDPSFTRAELNLARTEALLSPQVKVQMEGVNKLRQLARSGGEWEIVSLRTLVQLGILNPGLIAFDDKLATGLWDHPQGQTMDRCLVTDWKIRQFPSRREEWISHLVKGASELPVGNRREMAVWLNNKGLFRRTLEVFPLDPNDPQEMLLTQLDALAALGDWKGVSRFLDGSISSLDPVLLHLFRARAARELKTPQLFELGWKQAMRAAGENPQAYIYLAEYAEKLNEPVLAAEAYESLSGIVGNQFEVLMKLVRLYEGQGRTRDVYRTIQRIAQIRPDAYDVINDLSYLGLLLNDSPRESYEKARVVYEVNPRLPAFVATYALAQLKTGSPQVALQAFSQIDPATLEAPGWQAVYAATLGANGKNAEATKWAMKINVKLLKPEEKQLILEYFPRNPSVPGKK